MKRAAVAAAFALALVAAAAPDQEAELRALRDADLRVATIGYRLAAANREICIDHAPLSGLLIHDASQYDGTYREVARRLFGLSDGPAIEAVVPGGPGDRAGLRADDHILEIAGAPVVEAAAGRRASADAMLGASGQLEAALRSGPTSIAYERKGRRATTILVPIEGCASLVQLVPTRRVGGSADGRIVTITTALVNVLPNDADLAVVIGHELAHNALRHRAAIAARTRSVRTTEREADYVGVYLMARAGYPIDGVPAFWRSFGRTYGPGIFGGPDHPGWRKRERALATAIAEITAKRSRGEPLMPGRLPAE